MPDSSAFAPPQYVTLAQRALNPNPLADLGNEQARVSSESAALAQAQQKQMSDWLDRVHQKLNQSPVQSPTHATPNMLAPWSDHGNLIGAAQNSPDPAWSPSPAYMSALARSAQGDFGALSDYFNSLAGNP